MRLRKEPDLDPGIRRDLEALDAALAGRPLPREQEDLAALVVALREERPEPRPEFALDLDLRARDGFPAAAPARPRPRRAAAFRRRWGLALGTAASLFIVATAVLTSGVLSGDGSGDPSTVGTSAPQPGLVQEGERADGVAAAPESSVAPVPRPADDAPRARERRVERGASLTLAAPRDEIEETADGVIGVTDRHGGFVRSSNVTSGEGTNAGAALDLRVPSERLQPALADLSELAHVRARSQQTLDITAQFRSPRRRLADALAERRGLLRQLARADTPNETAAVRARLRAVNRRIDRARAELRRLRERVSFASVAVTIEPGGKAGDGGSWTLGDAAGDAVGVLRAVLGALLVALAVLVPAALLAGVAWLAYRGWLRRRREGALEV